MAEARFKLILEAEDQTKKAIDSASKNLDKLKQDAGMGGKGKGSSIALPPKTVIQKASFDIKQAIINVHNAKSNSGVSTANQDFFTKLPTQSKDRPGFAGVLKVDIVRSIPLNTFGGGGGRPSLQGGAGTSTGGGTQSWGGRNFPGGGSSGIASEAGRNISPAFFGLGAIVGTIVGIATKISQKYEQNIIEQTPLSGVTGQYRFNGRYVPTSDPNISLTAPTPEQQQQAQPEEQGNWFQRTARRVGRVARGLAQVSPLGLAAGGISRLASGPNQQEMQQAMQQVTLDRAKQARVNSISQYGLKPADIQRMAFEQARAGGAALTAQQYGDSGAFRGVAGYARGTGIDPGQAAQMQGQLQRYGGNLRSIANYGEGAGYKGATNPEFVQAVTEAVKSGVSQGFAGTPEEIAKSMNMMINLKDQRGNALFGGAGGRDRGMAAYKTVTSTMQGAGKLQGGNMQEIMLRSVIDDLQAKNPGMAPDELLQKAMEQLQNPANMAQNMAVTNRTMTSLHGTGAMRNIATAQGYNTGIDQGRNIATANWQGARAVQSNRDWSRTGVDAEAQMSYQKQNEQNALLMAEMGQNIYKAVKFVERQLLKLGELINSTASGAINMIRTGRQQR